MRTNPPRPRLDHPGYIVFGIDDHERKRAAWFSPRERMLARLASNMAGFWLFEPSLSTPERLAEWLPHGTRLESGRFVIPRVRQGLYQKLCDLEETARRATSCADDIDDADDAGEFEVSGVEADQHAEEAAAIIKELADLLNGTDSNEPEEG